jgi:hypothetical protein
MSFDVAWGSACRVAFAVELAYRIIHAVASRRLPMQLQKFAKDTNGVRISQKLAEERSPVLGEAGLSSELSRQRSSQDLRTVRRSTRTPWTACNLPDGILQSQIGRGAGQRDLSRNPGRRLGGRPRGLQEECQARLSPDHR